MVQCVGERASDRGLTEAALRGNQGDGQTRTGAIFSLFAGVK